MGMTLGVISFGSGFVRYGHGGASLNPARCLGVFVGGRWEGWHWIHWYVVLFLLPSITYWVLLGASWGLMGGIGANMELGLRILQLAWFMGFSIS